MAGNPIDRPIATWPLPVAGVIRTLPAHQLPDDAAYNASNIILYKGALTSRPGTVSVSSGPLVLTPIPLSTGALIIDGLGLPASTVPFIITGSIGQAFRAGTWQDITGTPLTVANPPPRTTQIVLGTATGLQPTMVIANGVDPTKQWDGQGTGLWSDIAGAPKWTDLCTAQDRIVGIVPPYTIQWGEQALLTMWPSANRRILADTAGDTTEPLVAISGRGDAGVIVYRRDSIWLGTPSGRANSAGIFQWVLKGIIDGPAGPGARVTVDGWDYYMTPSGRIARYDGGNQHEWVGDGVWPAIQAEIQQDPISRNRVTAFHDPRTNSVVFVYPKVVGSVIRNRGLVIVNLPYPAHGIVKIACWLGELDREITCAATYQYWDTEKRAYPWQALTTGLTSTYGPTAWDVDHPEQEDFAAYFQTPLAPMEGLRTHRLEAIELLVQRLNGYGTATVEAVTSNVLDREGGTVILPGSQVNLNHAPAYDLHGVDARGRYMGLKLSWRSTATVRYYGGVMGGRPI